MNYVISFQQTYVIKFWEPSSVIILSNYEILLVIPDKTCINFDHMVYYIHELRWASSDNTLKELDASSSFFIPEYARKTASGRFSVLYYESENMVLELLKQMVRL